MIQLIRRAAVIYREEGFLSLVLSSIRFFFLQISIAIGCIIYVVSHLVPKKEGLWVFGYGTGRGFTDNSKHLYLYTHECEKDITPIWVSKDRDLVESLREESLPAYEFYSIKGLYLTLRAGNVFVTHSRRDVPWWCTGGAAVVRLGHGIPFKKYHWSNRSEVSSLGPIKYQLNRFIFWNYDYSIATSDRYREFVAAAANLEPSEVFVTGLPRTDCFLGPEYDPHVLTGVDFDRLSERRNDNPIVFYFPTYRAGRSTTVLTDGEIEKLIQVIEKHDGYLFIKFHRNTDVTVDLDNFDRIIVLDRVKDFYPIFEYTDIFITDYSSLFYDAVFNSIPVVFHPRDKDTYLENRELFFEYGSVPGPIAADVQELASHVDSLLIGTDTYSDRRRQWMNLVFEDPEENSCEKIVGVVQSGFNANMSSGAY